MTTLLQDKHHILPAAELTEAVQDARNRTLALVADLSDSRLSVPLIETVNPFLWELGHTAFFYEACLLRTLDGIRPLMTGADDLYNSFTVEHDSRWGLALPTRDGTLQYMAQVHQLVLARLDGAQPDAVDTYLNLLAVLHEDMHGEAFTYMRQTLEYVAPDLQGLIQPLPAADVVGDGPLWGDTEIPGGVYQLGAATQDPFVFDNEKWAHPVQVEPFHMARAPVTNAQFAEFVEAGGYQRRDLWDYEGCVWLSKTGAQHPTYWYRGGGGGQRRHFDQLVPLEEHAPAVHVNWFEADAYCTWAGRRLPTEAEWDMAASAEPGADGHRAEDRRRYPWGHEPPTADRANLDSRAMGCVDVGAFAAGDRV